MTEPVSGSDRRWVRSRLADLIADCRRHAGRLDELLEQEFAALQAQDPQGLEDIAAQKQLVVSTLDNLETERRSMAAERDTTDRYLAAYLSDRLGAEFTGRISGIARFGVFVKLDELGADVLLPMRILEQQDF